MVSGFWYVTVAREKRRLGSTRVLRCLPVVNPVIEPRSCGLTAGFFRPKLDSVSRFPHSIGWS